jgi:hypothetical protein
VLLLSTHEPVLKDAAVPALAVKIQQHEVPAITRVAHNPAEKQKQQYS